jgi:hypothetical protein
MLGTAWSVENWHDYAPDTGQGPAGLTQENPT